MNLEYISNLKKAVFPQWRSIMKVPLERVPLLVIRKLAGKVNELFPIKYNQYLDEQYYSNFCAFNCSRNYEKYTEVSWKKTVTLQDLTHSEQTVYTLVIVDNLFRKHFEDSSNQAVVKFCSRRLSGRALKYHFFKSVVCFTCYGLQRQKHHLCMCNCSFQLQLRDSIKV